MKEQWTIQVAMPWQTGATPTTMDEKAERRRVRVAPRMGKKCALALAQVFLMELGKDAKVRIINPDTGVFVAMMHSTSTNAKNGIEVYNGREKRPEGA